MRLPPHNLLVIAAVASAAAAAVAALPQQHPFVASADEPRDDPPQSPERDADMAALLDKYAPVFKLSEKELFYPSSVRYMLDRYGFVEYLNGSWYEPETGVLSPERLDELPKRGKRQLLAVDVPANAQPNFPGKESGFMWGTAGQDGAMEIGPDGRGRVYDEVYGFWVDMGRGVVDLWYWTYYPYNLGKEVDVSDWEHLRVRTVNGRAESADFDTHSGGPFSAGTYRWSDMELMGDRPVAYVAYGSHGVWPTPGKHVYAQLLNLWQLVDVTDDRGALWDTQGHVVPIQWWTGPERAQRIRHTGDQSWLEFRGQWGNRGSDNCWWHPLVGICQLIAGPPGPNRDFGDPPDCIIGEADKGSRYSFFLSGNVTTQADALNVTTVVVEQVCARPSVAAAGRVPAGADPWAQPLAEHDLETWPMYAETVPYRGRAQHHATLPPCSGARAAAKAYRIVLYNDEGYHVSTSGLRILCLYEPGRKGWVTSGGARIDDVDEWRWWLLRPPP